MSPQGTAGSAGTGTVVTDVRMTGRHNSQLSFSDSEGILRNFQYVQISNIIFFEMSNLSVFCCLKGCLNNFKFSPTVPHAPRENPIHLDTSFMGYEVVIVKGGQRICGSGAALGNAPLQQSKSYFEVKIQQNGSWSIGLGTRQTDLSFAQGGMDEFSWVLSHDQIIRHNKQELYNMNSSDKTGELHSIQEGDIIGVTYDHIQLKFFLNGTEIDHPVSNVKGTVYPALYVDDGAILDIILDNFNYQSPSGFEKIMLEQSLL